MAVGRARRVRALGAGRSARRALGGGGLGPARRLNEVLGGWPAVRIQPMFGWWGYVVGSELFGCFPLRAKDHDLWVRLSPSDQARALRDPGVRRHWRFGGRGWVEMDVEGEVDVTSMPRLARAISPSQGPSPVSFRAPDDRWWKSARGAEGSCYPPFSRR